MSSRGRVITFYSYKGGTGRSMALANTACILAREQTNNRGVLMMDWDLDAPGLHEYFRSRLKRRFAASKKPQSAFKDHPGLIDFFYRLDVMTKEFTAAQPQSLEEAQTLIKAANISSYIIKTDIPSLYLLKAGQFDGRYSARVSTFPWEDLFRRSPSIIWALADHLTSQYSYVLVDSRTGLNDISGISTMLMPEVLVTVFTPNHQSLDGVLDLVRRATNYRRQSPDLRPLVTFPLPSRIDAERSELRKTWRYGDQRTGIPGYQPQFQQLFKEVYDLETCDLEDYFREIQVQHTPDFAYGEEIAVLWEAGDDRFSLTRSYESFAETVATCTAPWDLSLGTGSESSAAAWGKTAEAAFSRLSPDDQEVAQRVLLRLVRLASPEEGVRDTGAPARKNEFNAKEKAILETFARQRVLKSRTEAGGEEILELADDKIIHDWVRLSDWLRRDRSFLLWRQRLRAVLAEWGRSKNSTQNLLRGKSLTEARAWARKRGGDLRQTETKFVEESVKVQRRKALAASCALIFVLAIFFLVHWKTQQNRIGVYHAFLDSWDLPADLYERQSQLRALTVAGRVDRLDWLANGLEAVDFGDAKVESIEGLPSSIRSLTVKELKASELGKLPSSLISLQADKSDLVQLKGLPSSLKSLRLQAPGVLDLTGLPLGVESLELRAPLRSLMGIPQSLKSLSLRDATMSTLDLPGALESLELQNTDIVELYHLPAHLQSLVLRNNGELLFLALPQELRSFTDRGNKRFTSGGGVTLRNTHLKDGTSASSLTTLSIKVDANFNWHSLPDKLERLDLSLSPIDSLGPLPDSVNELDISQTWIESLKGLPRSLTILRFAESNLSSKATWDIPATIKVLDLNSARSSLALPRLPRLLEELNIRAAIFPKNYILPMTLRTLDVSRSGISSLSGLPPGLDVLNLSDNRISKLKGLPLNLRELDISGTQIRNLEGLPPHLKKLTLSLGQVMNLEGLPVSVEELCFRNNEHGGAGSF